MMRACRLLPALPLAAALLLAACQDDPAPAEDENGRSASGEVLEGTISDAMIPFDQLRSQPPFVVERPRAPADSAAEGAFAQDGGENLTEGSEEQILLPPPPDGRQQDGGQQVGAPLLVPEAPPAPEAGAAP